jgi:hypothetical protein
MFMLPLVAAKGWALNSESNCRQPCFADDKSQGAVDLLK